MQVMNQQGTHAKLKVH